MRRAAGGLMALLPLAGCVGGETAGAFDASAPSPRTIAMLQSVNEKAQKCWIKSGDKDFKGLAIIPEIDTRIGKPRLLIVDRGKATGLPKYVIEASGDPAKIDTYGPLSGTPVAARIDGDVAAWSAGRTSC